MSSLRSWFRNSSNNASASTSASASASTSVSASSTKLAESRSQTPSAPQTPWEKDMADLEDAMTSVSLILNDDLEGAEARLRSRQDDSTFHLLGLGLSTFMRSVLGFEKEDMNEASKKLLACETQALADKTKAEKEAAIGGAAATSSARVYPAGSEFALVHAEAQLMQAVVAQLHESITDAVRGFYKLRKAFVALNGIIEVETALLAKHGKPISGAGTRRLSFANDPMPGSFSADEFADLEDPEKASGDDSAADAAPYSKTATTGEKEANGTAQASQSKASRPPSSQSSIVIVEKVPLSWAGNGTAPTGETAASPAARPATSTDAEFLTNPVDVFVHSGANMCFGLLLVLISMVPPALSRLLYIVGFKGDRERGLRMMWQSTKFPNINGGLAAMVLLAFYNGLVGFSDVLPSEDDAAELADGDEIVGYPRERCLALLERMRKLYPNNVIWKLEEARLLANRRETEEAARLLHEAPVSRVKQVAALMSFELGLNSMCAMQWTMMHDAFFKCVGLNDWSHALYYYNAGCAQLELYRTHKQHAAAAEDPERKASDETQAARHKALAESLLRKAPTMAGKKTFMARQMPFDVFVIRKLARWEGRAAALGLSLADAIGVSPAQEMIYLWNGAKRMSNAKLEEALAYLDWSRCTAGPAAVAAFQAAPDESAIGSLCRTALLRSQGRLDEAQVVLDEELLVHNKALFKGPTKDDYVPAAAHYEAAVLCWARSYDTARYPASGDATEVMAFRRANVDACQAELDKVAKWEAYVLDARIGMRVQTALETVRWLKRKRGWA